MIKTIQVRITAWYPRLTYYVRITYTCRYVHGISPDGEGSIEEL